MQRWQRGSRGGGGGNTVAVASLAVEVAAWQMREFSRSSSVLEMRWQRGGGNGNIGALEGAAWRMLIIILIVTMMMMIERAGRMHRWRSLRWMAMTIAMVTV